MGDLNPFKKPSVPTMKPAPVAAPPSSSDASVQNAAAEELKKLKMQRGRAATLLTGGTGVMGDDSTGGGLATKMLLGG